MKSPARLFEFVAGLDVDAAVEFADADPRGARLQLADRHGHAAGQQQRGQCRQDKGEGEQRGGTQHRPVKRRQGLVQRQFDKHGPAERRDCGMRGQHRVAVDSLRDHRARGRRLLARGFGMGRRDLRQVGEVGIAQHEADVGMGDEPAVAVDDIGVAALPDLQSGDHIPDQLQIDLGDRDPGIASGAGQRHGHIRFGFLAEINRAEPHSVLARFDKAGGLRIVFFAANDVYRQPRDFELLFAGIVELGQLGDGRHLAQQAHIIETALLEGARGPLRRRGPAELALDLVDELLDAARRRPGLLLLNAEQRHLVFVIGEPEIERAVDEQHEADQPDDQQHIFAEQPSARLRRRPTARALLLGRSAPRSQSSKRKPAHPRRAARGVSHGVTATA